jgi:hypothetical protein
VVSSFAVSISHHFDGAFVFWILTVFGIGHVVRNEFRSIGIITVAASQPTGWSQATVGQRLIKPSFYFPLSWHLENLARLLITQRDSLVLFIGAKPMVFYASSQARDAFEASPNHSRRGACLGGRKAARFLCLQLLLPTFQITTAFQDLSRRPGFRSFGCTTVVNPSI